MIVYLGSNELKKVYLGNTEIKKIYVGDHLVCPKEWSPGSNTILYWKLDGNTNDSSGNGRNASYSNASFVNVGSPGLVASFSANSTNIYRDGSEIAAIKDKVPYTYSLRFYLRGRPSNSTEYYFIGWTGKTDYGKFDKNIMFYRDGSLYIYNYTTASYGFRTSSNTIQLNTWYNITVSYDGTTLKAYLNKTLIGSVAAPGSYPYSDSSGGRLILGRIRSGQAQGFYGYIGNFVLENYGWGQSEANNFYELTKGKYLN